MNDLTIEEYEKAPKLVQYIFLMSNMGHPVEIDKYNEAKHKYPEYFEPKNV